MSFAALGSLVAKDLRMFFRSKVSAIVVLLIPLLIVLFAGYSFDSSELSNVRVGVHSDGYTEFIHAVVADFEEDNFAGVYYDSRETCIDAVKKSDAQICVLFPAHLDPDVSSDEIVFHVDYSRINLADNLVNRVEESVFIRTSGVGETIAQDLINSLDDVKQSLPNSKEKVSETLVVANTNKNIVSSLDSSSDAINPIIEELEDIKDEVNESSIKSDIDDVIVSLEEIEKEQDDLLEDFSSLESGHDELTLKLEAISLMLDSIMRALESGRVLSAHEIVSPIETRVESVSIDANNSDYMIPIVLSLISLFGAILLSSTFVLKLKKTKAFFRNFMTPTKDIWFVVATYLSSLIILLAQFILVFIGLEYILGMAVLPVLGPLALVLFVSLSVFIVIGMFIGYLFRSDETIIFSSMIIAALFMFFSNVILPLENISTGLMRFLEFNPLVVSHLAMKKIVLFNLGLGSIGRELLILAGFFALFFALSYVFRRATRRIL